MSNPILSGLSASFEEAHRQHPYLFACAGLVGPRDDPQQWKESIIRVRASTFFDYLEDPEKYEAIMSGEFAYGECNLALREGGEIERFFLLGRDAALHTFERLTMEARACFPRDGFSLRPLFGEGTVREEAKEEVETRWLGFVFQTLRGDDRLVSEFPGIQVIVLNVGVFFASQIALATLTKKAQPQKRKRQPRIPILILSLLDNQTYLNKTEAELAEILKCSISSISRAFKHPVYGRQILDRYEQFNVKPPTVRDL